MFCFSLVNSSYDNEAATVTEIYRIVIVMKFSSLAALIVVILTTFDKASVENFVKKNYFPVSAVSIDYVIMNTC